MKNSFKKDLKVLAGNISGDIFTSLSDRLMYATDASEYRDIPLAVARPKDPDDIKKLFIPVVRGVDF